MQKQAKTYTDIINASGFRNIPQAKRVSIIVPTTINHFVGANKMTLPAPKELLNCVLSAVQSYMSKTFHGFSQIKQVGGWVDLDTNETITENGIEVYGYTAELSPETMVELLKLATLVQDALGQDSVLLSVDKTVVFVGWRQE